MQARIRQRGVAIIETVIALPILLAVILGAIQFGLIYEAKATLNYATLQAARSGAVSNADQSAIRQGLARGIVPLYSPDSSLTGYASTLARANQDLATDARVRILNPTREAFDDFGQDVEGERQLPNDHLQSRSTTVGVRSGLNIQDANLLRIQVTYGYELKVPLVNWFITRTLLAFRGSDAMDAFEQQLLRRTFLPIVSTSTVRMQSPARLNDAMVARDDLPDGERFAADTPPPDPVDREQNDEEGDDPTSGDSDSGGDGSDRDDGSSLADGFFGFGSGHGAGASSGGGSGSGSGSGSDGGANSGSPQSCDGGGGETADPAGPTEPSLSTSTARSLAADAASPNALPSLSVGNPIHVVTGNKYQHEIDIAPLPGELGLSFSRHYNSELSNRSGSLGAGWRHSFDAHVQPAPADASELMITQADGRAIKFLKSAEKRYGSQRAGDGELFVNRCLSKQCGEYVWKWANGRELQFDSSGALAEIREGGLVVRLEYDAQQRINRILDPQGRVLTMHYDRKGRISNVNIAGGASRRYRYDRRNNLVEVIATDGGARRYYYEDARHPHHLTGIGTGSESIESFGARSAFERIATWAYDERGRGVLSKHALDTDKVTLRYGQGFTDVADAFGRLSRYITDVREGIALVTQVQGPGCSACGVGDVSYSYSDAYAVTERRVKGKSVFRYEYDEERRIKEIYRDGKFVAHYDYERNGTEPIAVDRPSINSNGRHRIEIISSTNGRPTVIRESGFEPNEHGFDRIERIFALTYDQAGELIEADGPRDNARDVTKFEYDDLHQLTAIVNADGIEQRVLTRDNVGRPKLLRRTGEPDVEMSYDVEGRVTSLGTHLHSGAQLLTQFRYDGRGRLHEVELPDHRIRQLNFDAADRITTERTLAGLSKITHYAIDGQIDRQSLFDGETLLKTLYFTFDGERRLTEVRDGDGPALQQLAYSGADSTPSDIVDAIGRRTHLNYDAVGNLQRIVAAMDVSREFDRDLAERVTGVKSPTGSRTQYKYDDFGRRVLELSPDRGGTSYRYNAADQLVEQIDARGKTLFFSYSAAGALESIRSDDGDTTLAYRAGRIASILSPSESRSLKYDEDGRLTMVSVHLGDHEYETEFRYDELGRVSEKKLFSGKRISYVYDERGSLARIFVDGLLHDEDLVERALPRQPLSPQGDMRLGNGLIVRTRIDGDARLTHRGTQRVTEADYQYDDANRITKQNIDGREIAFAYDAGDHLTSAASMARVAAYRYDLNGNRTLKREASSTAAYEYDPGSNRLLSVNGEQLSYDAAGNVKAIGNRSYEYNAAGRPIRLWANGKLIAQYTYNAFGERIGKVDYSQRKPRVTNYLYEQHRLVAEADASGEITREYLYLEQHPVALIDNGEVFWIHTDHLGAPIAVTNKSRQVIWRAEYEPFGLASVDADPDRDGQGFELNLRRPGQYADRESGTYYNYYRDYDPSLGRYLTSDPLGVAAGTNTYAYAHSDPMNRFDSLGLYDGYVHFYMTYFLALVAGLPPEIANTIATASEYIDENPLTSPIGGALGGALPLYHFTLDYDGTPFHGDVNNDPLTRFYDPRSPQLSSLYRITTEAELNKLWDEVHPLQPGMCPFRQIEQTRYQLFGEFLHAYEDTFAHRDTNNMPYDVYSFNDDNDPAAWIGHVGLSVPDDSRAPDHTYNQSYTSNGQCRVQVNGSYMTFTMGEAECEKRNGTYIPPAPADWQYNELRTLRMEYETLEFLKNDFSAAIAENLGKSGRQFSWQDLAGTSTWDRSGVRIGADAELPVKAVLETFNAAKDEEKLAILNAWLADQGLPRVPPLTAGNLDRPDQAALARESNLGWIPASAESNFHILLPISPVP